MANNSAVTELVSLDFDTNKASLKAFLRAQDIFKDYDFDDANINVLLDVLCYNTFKNGFYLNMNMAESFIDSAQLLSSVLSKAKELNYTPRSARSAKASVTVSFEATGESQPYIIQKGSSFTTLVKNESFVFSLPETITVSSSNSSYTFTSDVYEGVYIQESYIFPSTAENQRFKISNRSIDTDSLTVTVYEDGSLIGHQYSKASSLLDVNAVSKVFFLQASGNGYYEIIFGDNVIGKQPKVNSTLVIDYRISAYDRPNGAKAFTINFDPTGDVSELTSTPITTTVTGALDGAPPESIESVRYYAPRHFQIQERFIVPTDYEIGLKAQFPEINAVSAIPGEDRVPASFGKIYIALDISDADGLPESKLNTYYNFVRARSPVKPVFIEPKFTYLKVDSSVRFNTNITTLSSNSIKTLVINAINTFNTNNLDDFGVKFRYSRFCEAIDDADDSIISNVTTVTAFKKLTPVFGVASNIKIDFGMALSNDIGAPVSLDDKNTKLFRPHKPGIRAVRSNDFYFDGIRVFLEDDGDGNMYMVKFENGYNSQVAILGTVDYSTGVIALTNFRVDSFDSTNLLIYVIPKDKDTVIPSDTIGNIDINESIINIEALKE